MGVGSTRIMRSPFCCWPAFCTRHSAHPVVRRERERERNRERERGEGGKELMKSYSFAPARAVEERGRHMPVDSVGVFAAINVQP